MSDQKPPTIDDFVRAHDEVMRRSQIMLERVGRMEFTSSTASGLQNEWLTSCALLYAGLAAMHLAGVPLHLLIRLVGFTSAVWEGQQEELFERLRREVLMQMPTDPNAKVN